MILSMRRIALAGVFAVLSVPLLSQQEHPVSAWAAYVGGNSLDYPSAAAMDAHGNMYVVGMTLSSNLHPALAGGPTRQYDFLMQILADGQLGWAVRLGDGPATRDVEVTSDGTVYVLYSTRIIIVDRNGTRIGETTLPATADHRFGQFQLAAAPRGGVIAAGDALTAGAILLTRIDRDGVRYARLLPVPFSAGVGDVGFDDFDGSPITEPAATAVQGHIYLDGVSRHVLGEIRPRRTLAHVLDVRGALADPGNVFGDAAVTRLWCQRVHRRGRHGDRRRPANPAGRASLQRGGPDLVERRWGADVARCTHRGERGAAVRVDAAARPRRGTRVRGDRPRPVLEH
jgi:hypothetical protein